MFHIVTGLETLIFLMFDDENKLRLPRLPQECLHGLPPKDCPESDSDGTYRCPSSNDVKYRMTRCSIDALDLYLVESGTAINIWVCTRVYFLPIALTAGEYVFGVLSGLFIDVKNV